MKLSKKMVSISMFLLMVIYLSSCGILPQSPEGKISGRVLIPPSEISKDITGWVPTANAEVTIVDADGITHTATTDENGYYNFEDIAVNPNTIITATITINGNTIILKDVIPQAVSADEDYDAGDMDPESTALALLLEALITSGENPLDIDIDEIKSSSSFLALVSQVTSVLEEDGDVTEDLDIAEMIEDIINPPVPPSPSSSSPTPKPDITISIAAIAGVTAPIAGETPITAISETTQYTGTVTWDPADTTFDYETPYTATITLTSKTSYTLSGLPADFFTVAGATSTNDADSGLITAIFPETDAGTGPVYNQTKNTYYNTIQKAINASGNDDIIVVSAGTYNENIVIDNKNIILKSSNPADSSVVASTIIDGQDQDSVVKILNGDTSTLEGFTIQNGNEPSYGGGGIFISGSSPVIRYNVIGDNTEDDVDTGNTGDCGGGICVVDGSIEPHIYQNKIIGNRGHYGGGMFIGYGSPLVENNIIKDNVSDDEGGGIIVVYSKKEGNSYCPTISNNIIEYNKTTNASGGGIVVDEEGSAIIENNQINNNETNFHGGGIRITLNSDAAIRGGNIIEDNKAGRHGGGIYIYSDGIISITSNTINNNIANIASGSYSGGGIYVGDGSPTIGGTDETDTDNFNTICGNTPDQVDPDSYPNNFYYEIGDTGPAGGIIFYIDESGQFDWNYLECAPNGWYDNAEDPILAWGPWDGTPGSPGDGVGTGIYDYESDLGLGEANTTLILAEVGDYPAAEAAAAYTGGSQTDWFLPSKSELSLMYSNLYLAGLGEFSDDSTNPQDFYWSSAETSPNSEWKLAWTNCFASAGLGGFDKTLSFRVRPIRAF